MIYIYCFLSNYILFLRIQIIRFLKWSQNGGNDDSIHAHGLPSLSVVFDEQNNGQPFQKNNGQPVTKKKKNNGQPSIIKYHSFHHFLIFSLMYNTCSQTYFGASLLFCSSTITNINIYSGVAMCRVKMNEMCGDISQFYR